MRVKMLSKLDKFDYKFRVLPSYSYHHVKITVFVSPQDTGAWVNTGTLTMLKEEGISFLRAMPVEFVEDNAVWRQLCSLISILQADAKEIEVLQQTGQL